MHVFEVPLFETSVQLLHPFLQEFSDSSLEENCSTVSWSTRLWWLLRFVMDLGASIIFWWVLLSPMSDLVFYGSLGAILLLMILWRVYKICYEEKTPAHALIPYTCAHLEVDNRHLYLVPGTVRV